MRKLQEFLNKNEKKIFQISIYVFLLGSVVIQIIPEFLPAYSKFKTDVMLVMILLAVSINFTLLRNLDVGTLLRSRMLVPYTSTTADMFEVEKRIERYRDCELIILGNTLTTMWNSFLKKYFNRVVCGELGTKQLNVVLMKRVEDLATFVVERDPVIPQISEWLRKNPAQITISIYVIDQHLFFTGICANKEYLRFRLLNSDSHREVLGTACKGDEEIENRIIEWFCNSVEEMKSKAQLIQL